MAKKLSPGDKIAILALIVSVAFPLVLRQCDRSLSNRSVKISAIPLLPLSPEYQGSIVSNVMLAFYTLPFVAKQTPVGAEQYLRSQSNQMRYDVYSVKIVNERQNPVSLSSWRQGDLITESGPSLTNFVSITTIFRTDDAMMSFEANPVINIEGNHTEKLRIVAATYYFPHGQLLETIINESRIDLRATLKDPTRDPDLCMSDITLIGPDTNGYRIADLPASSARFIYSKTLRAHLDSIRLKHATIRCVDQTGQLHDAQISEYGSIPM